MKWLKDIWNRIVSSNDEQYILKIKELEAELKEANEELESVQVQLDHHIDWYEEMIKQFELMEKQNNELLKELDTYKKRGKKK